MKNAEYHEEVERVIGSSSFGHSNTYANLLRYLTSCSLAQKIPKETTIAAEIFGKPDFDPSQSTLIRVYVYNLRKKLKAYYLNEGAHRKEMLHIPKGSYAIEFAPRQRSDVNNKFNFWKNKWLLSIAILALSFVFAVAYRYSENDGLREPDANGLWRTLIESEKPAVLILGDLFIYNEIDTIRNSVRTIRDPFINSLEDFTIFQSTIQRPHIQFEPATYTHLILGSAHWIKQLTEIFVAFDSDYSIQTISRFNPKQLQDYDMIVVGMHKTLGVFKSYWSDSRIGYDTKNDAFMYQEANKSTITVYEPKGNPDSFHTDYAYMAKIPGPNNNTIYIFSGIWDTGATQSLKNFTDSKLAAQLERQMKDRLNTLPEYYELLFEVSGIDRMELSSDIVHLFKIEK